MAISIRRGRALALVSLIIVCGLYYTMISPRRFLNIPQPIPFKETGRIHWKKMPEKYPVSKLIPLPTGKPTDIPLIQAKAPKEDKAAKTERLRRRDAVKESFVHSWEGYKAHAWLRDEIVPIAGGYRDTFGGWAASLVDALDTLWIMGLKDEFEIAVDAAKTIDFTTTEEQVINVFETTIRYMGGFLAAYDVSGGKYPVLLAKAIEVGELLMSCFDTPNRMPITRWSWKPYVAGDLQSAPSSMIVSELGSLSVEFTRLAQLTGEAKYYDAIQRISNEFEKSQLHTKLPGMWPLMIDASVPSFSNDNSFTLGGMSDSLYEYLPKQYMMLGGVQEQSKYMYEKFIEVAKRNMFFKPMNPQNLDLLISGDVRATGGGPKALDHRGQHLTCFTGGMVAIGARIFDRPDELEVARQLTDGCVWAYDSQVTGIAPEIFSVVPCEKDKVEGDIPCAWSDAKWITQIKSLPSQSEGEANDDYASKIRNMIRERGLAPGFTELGDRRYILRPEAIESVFIMYRVTGNSTWQDKAWRMFEKIEAATRTEIAFSAIHDVTQPKPQKIDSMESFWLAETLKYFYLIFEDVDVVSLDEYVLNTEAHPLKRPGR